MECPHCKGRMEKGSARFAVERRGYHVTWDAIPAWVCTQCGESLFEAHDVESIQRALSAIDRETAQILTAA